MTTAWVGDVGRMMANFARVEWGLATGIVRLMGAELPAGQMVALELPFVKKCAVFSGLCQAKLEQAPRRERTELKTVMRRLLQSGTSRSQFTHPLWLRPSPHPRGERTRIARLKAAADQMAETADAVATFVDRHFENARGKGARRRRTRG